MRGAALKVPCSKLQEPSTEMHFSNFWFAHNRLNLRGGIRENRTLIAPIEDYPTVNDGIEGTCKGDILMIRWAVLITQFL